MYSHLVHLFSPYFACYISSANRSFRIPRFFHSSSRRCFRPLGVSRRLLCRSPTLSRNHSALSFGLVLSLFSLSLFLVSMDAYSFRPERRVRHGPTRKSGPAIPFCRFSSILQRVSPVFARLHHHTRAMHRACARIPGKPWTFTMGAADGHGRLAEPPA